MVVFGGKIISLRNLSACNDVLIYDVANNSWTQVEATGDVPSARYGHSAAATDDTNMVVYGGRSTSRGLLNDLYVYDIVTNVWRQLKSPSHLTDGRAFAATLLFNYTSFVEWIVFGGVSNSSDPPPSLILKLGLDTSVNDEKWSAMNTAGLAYSNSTSSSCCTFC